MMKLKGKVLWLLRSIAVSIISGFLGWMWFFRITALPIEGGRWRIGSDYSGLIILDNLFGLPYWLVHSFGLWHAGPSWFEQSPIISLFCYFIWPVIILLIVGVSVVGVFTYFWNKETFQNRIIAFFLPMTILIIIASTTGTLAEGSLSWWRYSFSNW